MRIRINGTDQDVNEGFRLADLLLQMVGREDPPGVAVAVNDAVVPRPAWPTQALCPGDRIEVVGLVGGG